MMWLLLGLGCQPPEDPRPAVDPSEGTEEVWSLQVLPVVSNRLEGVERVQHSVRSPANDWAYLVDLEGGAVNTVTAANVQPRGSYCVGGEGEDEDCTGVLRNPGRIGSNESLNVCVDEVHHRITLVQDKGRVELIGASGATEHWRHEHSVYEVWQPPETADSGLVGPCFWSDEQLWMSGLEQVVAVDAAAQSYSWETAYDLPVGMRKWASLGSGGAVGVGLDGRLYSFRTEEGSVAVIPTGSGVIHDLVVDRARSRLWFADRDRQQLRAYDWDGDNWSEVLAWETRDRVTAVEVDEGSGAVATLEQDGSGRSWLGLYASNGFQTRAIIEGDALSLVPPGALGQFAVVSRLDTDELAWRVWTVEEPGDARPPLGVFAVTTLEEPFLNLAMPCEDSEEAEGGFIALVETLRDNLDLLESVGLPVAVGVTWEFVYKALECRQEEVLTSMADRGLELGHMVHSRPCFNCTDGEVPGVTVAECGPTSPHYLLNDDPSACWPDDPEYCDLGDSACWAALVGQRALEVDEVLPDGASFIFGADRHGLWEWDWVEGYRSFERADGSQGYHTTLFAGRWAYPSIASFDDPRGKEPAPLFSHAIGKPWFVGHAEDWDSNSAFSELLYLPGHSVALLKAGEHQATGLSLLHLVNSGLPIGLDRTDTDVVMGLLRQAVARRDAASGGSWYLHIRDLTSWRLDTLGEDGLGAVAHLQRWRAEVESEFGANEVRWMLPSEIRQRHLEAHRSQLDE